MNDNEIVDLYLLRDEKAIVITKEKYGRRIKQILYEIIGDYHYVEECEDDCYLNIWNSIPPRIPYDYFFSYITVVARNIAINFIKSKKIYPNDISIEYLDKESAMHSFSGLNQINELMEIYALMSIFNSYILSLNDEKRNIFVRRYGYMDTVKEISQVYKISESKVKTILYRCRKELREILIKEGYNI